MAVARQTTEEDVPRRSAAVDEDRMIRLAVERLLQSSDHRSVREARVFVEDRVVMLFGTLTSYHQKQMLQADVMNLKLVERVENHCAVVPVV